ncbi:hypothetical protein KUTeg_013789, partial [Tegillarca granosa]
MQQYALQYYQNSYFPNSTRNISDGEQSVCSQNTSSQEYKDQQLVQSVTSELSIYWSLAQNIPAIFLSIIYGSLSDRYGRKLIIIISLLGTGVKAGLCALGIFLNLNIYISIVFFGVEGFTGTWISSLMALFAYGADITKPGNNRTVIILLLETFLGVGAVIGMLVSGYLIKYLGFSYANVIASGFVAVGVLITLIFLPESVHVSEETKKTKIDFSYLNTSFKFYTVKNFSKYGKRWQYLVCLSIFVLIVTANLGKATVESLYVLNSPFCWNSVTLGWFGALRSGLLAVTAAAIVKPLQFCFRDENIIIIGALSYIASCILEAFTTNNIVMFMVPVVGALTNIQTPVIRSMMSKMTSPDVQGALFAGIAALESVCNLTSSVISSGIYAETVSIFRGLVFLVMAGLNLLAALLV